MEQIIKTLAEIDQKSAKIMEAAANEKNSLADAAKKRQLDYQQISYNNTQQQLSELHEHLTAHMNAELQKQIETAARQLSDMDNDYTLNHTQLAAGIFNSLIAE